MNPDWQKPRPEHLPEPSYAPPLMAIGLMCILWGLVTHWAVSAVGIVMVGVASVYWIAALGRER